MRSNVNFKEADRLAELNNVLTQALTGSLTESAKNISAVLRRFANDFKLKKSLETFVAEYQPTQAEVKPAEQPVQAEVVPQVKVEETKPEPQPVVQ